MEHIQLNNPKAVQDLCECMPNEEILYDLAELFRVFGDSTRIKIMYALFESELCVGDISEALNMTQSAVSHQLRVLKANKLVKLSDELELIDNFMYIINVRYMQLN